jgi:hypothetical protein
MIWKNGSMELVKLKDIDGDTLFLNISNNELIKGSCVEFNHQEKTVHWQHGAYYGNIKNYIKLAE